MIDLNTLDNDPWPTIPVKKDDLRALAAALESMERDLRRVTADANRFYETLALMVHQTEEPKAQTMARRALGLEKTKKNGFIL